MASSVRYHVQPYVQDGVATVAAMSERPFVAPDVLVLSGGGIVGEAWMQGVLAGIEDAAGIDFRDPETFVGTSAGSIVSARLAAGRRPPRPRDPRAHEALAEQD